VNAIDLKKTEERRMACAHLRAPHSAKFNAPTWLGISGLGRDDYLDIRPASHGGDIQIGNILLIRSGFAQDYFKRSLEEKQ